MAPFICSSDRYLPPSPRTHHGLSSAPPNSIKLVWNLSSPRSWYSCLTFFVWCLWRPKHDKNI